MENKKEKTCKNCRFFEVHYIKQVRGFILTGFGHCNNTTLRTTNKYKIRQDCKHWQPAELHNTKLNERITVKLEKLTKQLSAVCEVLLDDNKN